jgi:hypothetical protein
MQKVVVMVLLLVVMVVEWQGAGAPSFSSCPCLYHDSGGDYWYYY